MLPVAVFGVLGLVLLLAGLVLLPLIGPAPLSLRQRFVRNRVSGSPAQAIPSRSYLNDDYCDTGLDEPLTSACAGSPQSVFGCRREGSFIPSSRVGDGKATPQ